MSAHETVNSLNVRSLNGTAGASHTTTLDLASFRLTASTDTSVFSATGVASSYGFAPTVTAGAAANAVFDLKTGVLAGGTLNTGRLNIGHGGLTATNRAEMFIRQNVTVNVVGTTFVGGAQLGRLTMYGGSLNGTRLDAGGVSGPMGAFTSVKLRDGAKVVMSGGINWGRSRPSSSGTVPRW